MNQLYAFSPITSKQQFHRALIHLITEAQEMSETVAGCKLAVATVKIFAHYPDEFEFMKTVLEDYGTLSTIGRSTSVYVDSTLTLHGNHIAHVGIRVPDPYRLQTGCVDYAVEHNGDLLSSLRLGDTGYIRRFPDMPEDYIELWHPDFDVIGYIPLRTHIPNLIPYLPPYNRT